MRWVGPFIMGLAMLAGGCGSASSLEARRFDDSGVAPALAFDPPVLAGQAFATPWRDDRDPQAFVAWDGPQITRYYHLTDDREIVDRGRDWAWRQAVVERFGESYR